MLASELYPPGDRRRHKRVSHAIGSKGDEEEWVFSLEYPGAAVAEEVLEVFQCCGFLTAVFWPVLA